ncbi:hypothetical protein KA478_02710 [Patescibacteria group bacterium]|nr:hypothetical protein [Patescibacteria group bacterium]
MMATELGNTSIKRMIDEYGELQKKIKALEDHKKSLGVILQEYASTHEETRFFGNEFVLSTRKYEKAVYTDPLQLLRRMKELELLSQYAKPNDSTLLKDLKA